MIFEKEIKLPKPPVKFKCSGYTKSNYKTERRIMKNPSFGITSDEPEFITQVAFVETDSVCVDCKKKECNSERQKKEANL